MRRMGRRIVSVLLSAVMVCSLPGIPGYAEEYRDAVLPAGNSGGVEAVISGDIPDADAEIVIPDDGPGGAGDVPAEAPEPDSEQMTDEIPDAAGGDGTAAGEGPADEAAADAAGSIQNEAPAGLVIEGIETVAEVPAEAAAEITLYAQAESTKPYLSIPVGCVQSYDLGGRTGRVTSGKSVVIEGGTVKPAFEVWYYSPSADGSWLVGSSNPTGNPGEYEVKQLITGDSTVLLDDGTELVFHVRDYALMYSEGVMDQYLAANITAGMTEYRKADLCCKFVAGYNYGLESNSYVGLIVFGSGDCWASTNALLYLLGKLGISAQSHNGSFAPGAGSGHVNVMAKLDGKYYILDAGFEGTAPRFYSIDEIGVSPFKYKVLSSEAGTAGTIAITEYADMEKESTLEIPGIIDGYTVTEIADGAFSNKDSLVHVTIPDTVEKIGKESFVRCDALETVTLSKNLRSIGSSCFSFCESLCEIRIPASVTEIAGSSFSLCRSLERVEVDAGNAAFCSEDGVLFDKGKTRLIAFPAAKRPASYTVPASVQTIGSYAFCYGAVKSLILPAGLREIEREAFYQYGLTPIDDTAYAPAELDPLVLPAGMTSVASYAFEDATIEEIVLPAGMRRIEDYAFYKARIQRINFPQGLEYIGEGAFAGMGFQSRTFVIPNSVTQIASYAFHLAYGWSSMGEGAASGAMTRIVFEDGCNITFGDQVFSASILVVDENSPAHRYAIEQGVPYELRTDSEAYGKLLDLKLSNEKDGIVLSWNALDQVEQYEIYRKKQGDASFALVQTAGGTSWTDTGTESAEKYSYRLEFTVGGVKISVPAVSILRLEVPKTIKTRPGGGINTIILWSPVKGADEYRVYYRLKGEDGGYGWGTVMDTTPGSDGFFQYPFGRIENYDVWVVACGEGYVGAPAEVKQGASADGPDGTNADLAAPKKLEAKNTSSGIKVSWGKAADADGYYVYRKTGNGSYGRIAVIKKRGTLQYTDKEVKSKNGTLYTYAVMAYRGAQTGKICESGGTIMRLTAPGISKLKNTSKKLTAVWEKNGKAGGYQLQYATSSSFKNAKTVKISSGKTVKKTIKNPKKKKTYYVRVRSFKKKDDTVYYSAWSATKKIKITK